MHMETKTRTEAAFAARVEAETGESAVFVFEYNLDFSNVPVSGAAAVAGGALYYAPSPDSALERFVPTGSDTVEYRQYVGCAALECVSGGTQRELLRSDMRNSAAMRHAVMMLRAISHGRTVGSESTTLRTRCPKCGTPFPHGSTSCPRCVDRKRLLSKLWPFVRQDRRGLLIAVALFFVVSALEVLLPSLNRSLIDGYITVPGASENGFFGMIAAIAVTTAAIALLQAVRSIVMVKVGNRISVRIRKAVYSKVQSLSLSDITRRTSGEIITRVTSDTQVTRDFLVDLSTDIIQMLLLFIAILSMLLAMNWALTLMILIPMPIAVLIFYSFRRRMNRMYHRQWRYESALNTLLHDVFSGIRVVKVFGTEKREEERFDAAAKRVADISKRTETTWNLIMPFANFLMGIGEYVVLLFVGARVISGEMTLGELSQFMTYVGMLYGPIRWAAFIPRRIARAMTSMAKIFELLDEKPGIGDGDEAYSGEIEGNIRFDNVSFGYNEYEYVLKNINLDINKGEMVGIVGRSGVGKSTMINLIMRLYDVNEGVLSIDGRDIRQYSRHALAAG